MNLKERFLQLCLQINEDLMHHENLWLQIEKKYSAKGRFYHDLIHLEALFDELDPVKNKISNDTNISFSVFYHDIIYDATSKLNEEKSAAFAKDKLEHLGLNKTDSAQISAQISATKSHHKSDDNDTNYLLDADLSVFGKDRATYIKYTENIRKEYAVYLDFLYKPGRKKILQKFLELESIFKTEYFRNKYELAARKNIEWEIKSLSS